MNLHILSSLCRTVGRKNKYIDIIPDPTSMEWSTVAFPVIPASTVNESDDDDVTCRKGSRGVVEGRSLCFFPHGTWAAEADTVG